MYGKCNLVPRPPPRLYLADKVWVEAWVRGYGKCTAQSHYISCTRKVLCAVFTTYPCCRLVHKAYCTTCPTYLLVGSLGLGYRLIKVIAGGNLARQALVDLGKPLGEDANVVLDVLLLLLLLQDLLVQLVSLVAQVLQALLGH